MLRNFPKRIGLKVGGVNLKPRREKPWESIFCFGK
jgi:hypothetical protein